jgi:hypothetical protein
MPVELTFLPGDIGLLYVCSGEATAKDFISANCQLLAVPNQFAACKYAIVDLTYISSLSVSASELREVADLNMRMAAIQPHLAVAVVAPTDFAFGMSRMWEVMAEKTGWTIMVFRTRAEGEDWVRGIRATSAPSASNTSALDCSGEVMRSSRGVFDKQT